MLMQVNAIQDGGYFGELGLMNNRPRATSIVANGSVRVACKYYGDGKIKC